MLSAADDRKSKPKRAKWVLNKRKVKYNISKMPYRDLQFRLETQRFNDEFLETITSLEQVQVEDSVASTFRTFNLRYQINNNLPKLLRWEHKKFLQGYLSYLPESYQKLDASRPWLCYWILQSLSLLEARVTDHMKDAIVDFLAKCQCESGGFGGGPGQYAHLAPTYAAVNSLCIIGTEKAYNVINRVALQNFLKSVRSPDGAFSMHADGEIDIRGVYCALSVATLTNICTKELFDGTAEWVISCQSYEGGFSGCPGLEAHGGYAFCGLASLVMLRKVHLCDVQSLLRWTVNKQMRFEGGFQGRTNKLVDGCYSFWQGAAFPIIHELLAAEDETPDCLLFNQSALQEYILICCQYTNGGLLDKPGKPRDVYHTCYTLSGLSVAQHSINFRTHVVGPSENKLAPIHPVYNILPEMVRNALEFFGKLPVPLNVEVSNK